MADSGGDYLGLLGLLAAAGIASAGSIYNNRQQRKLQESVNSEAIDLANTAHQREVADLRAAGLNPILSATGSGAATPSLGTAQLDNVVDSFGGNARGIGDMLSKRRQLENLSVATQIRKTDADADASIATASNLKAQNENLHEQNENLKAERENIKADTLLKQKQGKSRTIVGGAIEDVETHSAPVVNSGKALYETVKALNDVRKESRREILPGVSDRTLHIMEQRGISPEEVMRRVYEHRTRKGKK